MTIPLPDEWNNPKFRFGEPVYVDGDTEQAPVGIVGMDYAPGEGEHTWRYRVRRGNIVRGPYEEEQLSRKRQQKESQ